MESNQWAETGSLTHAAIEAYHKTGSEAVANVVMAHKRKEYPLADAGKAATHFRRYVQEQAAWGEVIEGSNETKVVARLAPTEDDPTQEEIWLSGTIDHVRVRGADCVCDIKTGSKPAAEMINVHAPQLAAYQLGWYQRTGNKPSAAIIRTVSLQTGGIAFLPCPWSFETALLILDSVRHFVAQVRRSQRIALSGKHCDYCPAGGIAFCQTGTRAKPAATHDVRDAATLFGG